MAPRRTRGLGGLGRRRSDSERDWSSSAGDRVEPGRGRCWSLASNRCWPRTGGRVEPDGRDRERRAAPRYQPHPGGRVRRLHPAPARRGRSHTSTAVNPRAAGGGAAAAGLDDSWGGRQAGAPSPIAADRVSAARCQHSRRRRCLAPKPPHQHAPVDRRRCLTMAAASSLAARCSVEMLGTALAVANHVLGFNKGDGLPIRQGGGRLRPGLWRSSRCARGLAGAAVLRLRWPAAQAHSSPVRCASLSLGGMCARVPLPQPRCGHQSRGWRRGAWRLPAAAAGKGPCCSCCCCPGRGLLIKGRLRCPPPRAAGGLAGGWHGHLAGVPAPLHGRRPGEVGGPLTNALSCPGRLGAVMRLSAEPGCCCMCCVCRAGAAARAGGAGPGGLGLAHRRQRRPHRPQGAGGRADCHVRRGQHRVRRRPCRLHAVCTRSIRRGLPFRSRRGGRRARSRGPTWSAPPGCGRPAAQQRRRSMQIVRAARWWAALG
jgi:hypothetical protein